MKRRSFVRIIDWIHQQRIALLVLFLSTLLTWTLLPPALFDDPLSTVLFDRNKELLGARIADDGQWRFPAADSIPEKYITALIQYEDRYFYQHPGINPVSILRAVGQNIKARQIVSGGSTLTMQVMRMARKNRPRTVPQKLIESLLAVRLELTYTKDKILKLYANNAPFGGNVIGIEAASWRYFGTAPENLTWSESALLAVLPNSPSLIHPGRNRDLLRAKRNRLLEDLLQEQKLDSISYVLSIDEPLPEAPLPLPNLAHHLTDQVMVSGAGKRFYSTIDRTLQERLLQMMQVHHNILRGNQVHNLACLVVEVESGAVLAYAGNSLSDEDKRHGNDVDVIKAPRSTGSILKPFLYAGMLDNGDILQTNLIPDVPIRYNGYAPKNYNRGYEGAVPASQALERSLNIPSVIMLKRYGVDAFLELLRKLGFTTFRHSEEYYGLTLILGGAETTLWELAGVYGSLARVLKHYTESNGNYFPNDFHMPLVEANKISDLPGGLQEEGVLSAGSIYLTFKSMLEVNRPEELSLWYLMSSSRNIAWKTGTSYGYRDAWAVGVTPEYLVAVWAGNADGEGRPGLSGVTSAAPLMFDMFSLLPETGWFQPPLDNLADAVICRESGYLAGPDCADKDTLQVVSKGLKTKSCPYHFRVHLDSMGEYRVNGDCYPVSEMKSESWFILPPLMEWYYKQKDPSYRELPPVMEGCRDESISELEIVYPEWNSHLVIPRELDGTRGKVIMEVAHRRPDAEIFWHIDELYIGTTHNPHRLAVDIQPGMHKLTVVDGEGYSKSVKFEVLGR